VERFSQEIRLLLDNPYIFAPFWNHQNGLEGYADWESRLASGQKVIARAMAERETAKILSTLFDRLYVLRNQLVHGGATWNSSVNRDQVRDGTKVLGWLLPIMIDIMMDNPGSDWGKAVLSGGVLTFALHDRPRTAKGPTSITVLGTRAFARKIRHVGG
jgi:hypothetical protein